MKEEQIQSKITVTNLYRKLRTDKTEVSSQFNEKAFQFAKQPLMQLLFAMAIR